MCELQEVPENWTYSTSEALGPGEPLEELDLHPLQGEAHMQTQCMCPNGDRSGPGSSGSDVEVDPGLDASDVRLETARKARRRAMAKRVGFVPTDP